MAKITVTLNCQWDNGKVVKLPGETVSMDEKEARSLADMGMVTLGGKEENTVKSSGKANMPPKKNGDGNSHGQGTTDADTTDSDGTDGELDPDALDRGANGTEGADHV